MSFSNSEAKSLQKAIEQAVSNGATSYTRKYRSVEVAKSAGSLMNGGYTVVPLACGEAVLVVDLSGAADAELLIACLDCMKITTHTIFRVKHTAWGACKSCRRMHEIDEEIVKSMQ